MSYYFTTTITGELDAVEEQVKAALKERGFGVLTEIDIQATLKKKIDKDIYPYKILGACNPPLAFQSITAEDKIGLMLPCNVILQVRAEGRVEVSAVDPMASMQAVQNENLGEVAAKVQGLLKEMISSLS